MGNRQNKKDSLARSLVIITYLYNTYGCVAALSALIREGFSACTQTSITWPWRNLFTLPDEVKCKGFWLATNIFGSVALPAVDVILPTLKPFDSIITFASARVNPTRSGTSSSSVPVPIP